MILPLNEIGLRNQNFFNSSEPRARSIEIDCSEVHVSSSIADTTNPQRDCLKFSGCFIAIRFICLISRRLSRPRTRRRGSRFPVATQSFLSLFIVAPQSLHSPLTVASQFLYSSFRRHPSQQLLSRSTIASQPLLGRAFGSSSMSSELGCSHTNQIESI